MPFRIATITGTVQLLLRRKCYSRYSACPGLCQRISLCPPSKQTLARDNQALRSCHLVLQAEKNQWVCSPKSFSRCNQQWYGVCCLTHFAHTGWSRGCSPPPLQESPTSPSPLPALLHPDSMQHSKCFLSDHTGSNVEMMHLFLDPSFQRKRENPSPWPSFSEPGVWLPCTLTW